MSILVTRIEVTGLFGRYDYCLELPSTSVHGSALLYGDNGSGKTSILRLLFHATAPHLQAGHRTHLLNQTFSSLSIHFSNGWRLIARREDGRLEGDYQLSLFGEEPGDQFTGKVRGTDRAVSRLPERIMRLLRRLQEFAPWVYLLADDRSLLTSHRARSIDPPFGRRRYSGHLDEEPSAVDVQLANTLHSTTSWLQTEYAQGSSRGHQDAQDIYAQIVSAIECLSDDSASRAVSENDKDALIEELDRLGRRSRNFAEWNLLPEFQPESFVKKIREVGPKHQPLMREIIRSLIETQSARLNALQSLKDVIQRFSIFVNGLLFHKSIVLDPRRGVVIVTEEDGKELEPSLLSSGEKQLLLLLCRFLVARSKPTLLLVDEPELSLNVKWQRQLVDMLLEMTSGQSTQFILATHSVELLAKHRDLLVQLRP